MEDDSASSPPPRGAPYQSFRSTNSSNWRLKDDSPRQESPQQGRYRRDDQEQGQSREGGGGYGRRDYQPREPREIPDKPSTPRLYVGNLLYTAQSGDITNFFANNGFNVVNVSMSIDPATGRNPSYCFVDLESVEEASRAMEQLNGAEVMGRSVRINPGVARKDGQSGGGQRREFGGGDRGAWRDRDSNAMGNPRGSNERWGGNRNESGGQQYSRSAPSEQGKRIYVGGLPAIEPQSAVEGEITNLFARADPPIEVASVSNLISPHPSKAGEPGDHHYLFVDLKAEADVERAIDSFNNMDSPYSDGGRLRVNRAKESRDRGEGRGDGMRRGGRDGGGMGGSGGGGGGGRGYGRPQWRNDPQGE